MSTTYTPDAGLEQPAHADRGWDVPLNANTTLLDGMNAIGGLCVTPNEFPSASLIVKVADGPYALTNDQTLTYAGGSVTLTASGTFYLWLDESGTLHSGAAYPTMTPYCPLAKVVTGLTTISTIADNRVPWRTVGYLATAGQFYGGPATGSPAAPTFRALVNTDVPQTLTHAWVTDFIATVESIRLDQMAAPTAAVSFNSQNITNLADPANPQDAATKHYVDIGLQGLTLKPSALCGTISTLPTNTYNNGSSGTGATLTATVNGVLTIDGVSPAVSAYVLVKNEVTTANNGLYTVTATGSGSAPWVLTRAVSMETGTEFAGAVVVIESGTVNAGTLWVCTDTGTISVGSTGVFFIQLAAASSVAVGTTAISGGTTGDILYVNAGVLGQLGLTAGQGLTLQISSGHLAVAETVLNNDTDGATITFDLSVSNKHSVVLGGNRTLALANETRGLGFLIRLEQDTTGGRTVTWWSGINWPGGTAPTLTNTASKTDVFAFLMTGAGTYDGYIVGQDI